MSLYISLEVNGVEVYSTNYTHNVAPMWRLIGVYEDLYYSEGISAEDLQPKLKKGLKNFIDQFDKCEELNPANGWGDALGAFKFLLELWRACVEHPKAIVDISR